MDRYISRGDLWGFILSVDADYKRFIREKEDEEENVSTFVSTLLREKQLRDDQTMQQWHMSAALQSPIVRGIRQMKSSYQFCHEEPVVVGTEESVANALLHSALTTDLKLLQVHTTDASAHHNDDQLLRFPPEFSAKVIRFALADGYSLNDIVATL